MRQAFAFVLAALVPVAAAATPVVDQEQPRFVAGRGPLTVGGVHEQKLAQTVTAGVDGPLVAVHVPVGCASGTLVVEIVSVDIAHPGRTILGRAEVAAGELSGPPHAFRAILLDEPVRMREGQRFAVVLRNPSGECSVARPPDGESYTRGDLFIDARPGPHAWVPARDSDAFYDMAFKTLVDRPRGEPPCRTEFGDLPAGHSAPVCRCIQEPGLRVQRCALLHPSFFAFRRIPWPLPANREYRVQWTIVALTDLNGSLEIDDALARGKPLRFKTGRLGPGQSITLHYDAVAPSAAGEIDVQTAIRGTKELTGTMYSTIEVAPPRP